MIKNPDLSLYRIVVFDAISDFGIANGSHVGSVLDTTSGSAEKGRK